MATFNLEKLELDIWESEDLLGLALLRNAVV
jgi:hypothetical protein